LPILFIVADPPDQPLYPEKDEYYQNGKIGVEEGGSSV
jgi:hypothetical protein